MVALIFVFAGRWGQVVGGQLPECEVKTRATKGKAKLSHYDLFGKETKSSRTQ